MGVTCPSTWNPTKVFGGIPEKNEIFVGPLLPLEIEDITKGYVKECGKTLGSLQLEKVLLKISS